MVLESRLSSQPLQQQALLLQTQTSACSGERIHVGTTNNRYNNTFLEKYANYVNGVTYINVLLGSEPVR